MSGRSLWRVNDRDQTLTCTLDREALEFLITELPSSDGFTQDLRKVLDRLDAYAALPRPIVRLVVSDHEH